MCTKQSDRPWPHLANRPFRPHPPGDASGAVFSECGRYRYILWRWWDDYKPVAAWVMLNPSTADASSDDPTIRRCIAFTKQWNLGGIVVVNLFAARSTDPALLGAMDDPIGPENDEYIRRVCREAAVNTIVCAWGVHGALHSRGRDVHARIWQHKGYVSCLGVTKDGHPKHPLYLAASTALERFA
ncbi:MAG: hypothetical protein JWP44_4512 [Mucilaginibacter sp.]|nr:hypothetical protein [Mucilaginibacter sp.]